MRKRLVIAGAASGAGKTTITLGLMAAWKQQGWNVQGFKCGPDYIDPSLHKAVTGRPARNLDSWMLPDDVLAEVFQKGSDTADISIVEGVMGLYDGKYATSNQGSTAEISQKIDAPIILVVDCSKMARSAAAIVKGYQLFDDTTDIAGVIASKVGSEGHYRIIKEAVEQACGIPVCGYLPRMEDLEMPERHLGLIPAIERGELDDLFNKMGRAVMETVDMERLLQISESKPWMEVPPSPLFQQQASSSLKIAIAEDKAFNFYYPENLELLEARGVEVLRFSPLAGEKIPKVADGVYLGGGFPELYAERLSEQKDMRKAFLARVEEGLPVLAECGGFMFLTKAINGHAMVGAISGDMHMQEKLAAVGYREIHGGPGNFLLPEGETARGHEFHYSVYRPDEEHTPAYFVKGTFGEGTEGVIHKNIVAGYTHIHFASNPSVVDAFLNKCREVRNS